VVRAELLDPAAAKTFCVEQCRGLHCQRLWAHSLGLGYSVVLEREC
jgi:hypothetical protein